MIESTGTLFSSVSGFRLYFLEYLSKEILRPSDIFSVVSHAHSFIWSLKINIMIFSSTPFVYGTSSIQREKTNN